MTEKITREMAETALVEARNKALEDAAKVCERESICWSTERAIEACQGCAEEIRAFAETINAEGKEKAQAADPSPQNPVRLPQAGTIPPSPSAPVAAPQVMGQSATHFPEGSPAGAAPLTREEIEGWRRICNSHWASGMSHEESHRQADALCDLALRATEQPARPSEEAVKVMQSGPDDCMRACLATYFGCALEDVPELQSSEWTAQVRQFARKRGFGYVTIAVPNEDVFKEAFSSGMLIVSGKSARERLHAVIYKDGALWHDPHPDSDGIKAVEQADFFYPLVPLPLLRLSALAKGE